MSKYILLTRVYQELTPEAEEKLDAIERRMQDEVVKLDKNLTDDNGNNAEWYRNMGMPVPDFLLDKNEGEIIFEETVDLTETDYIETRTKFLCNTKQVKYFDQVEKGTLVMYNTKVMVVVAESIEEINKLILG